ncbi:MAG: hypothetical protein JO197_08530 [Acidobacteria bacterium]|nr:hypothetical protein [Acidobacteriota bacterium]MBV9478033.1 hypothetical protein [Acidobacteriota bacterium]
MKRWTIDDAPTSVQLREIAPMLGGESVSASAAASARELLRAGSHATKVRA